MSPIIEVHHVSKRYPARRGPRALSGRGGLGDWLLGRGESTFTALDDISFTVEAGASLGIIGRNGSGKSTLLSILAGVTLPTSGHVRVWGRVASLLELGAGFSPMLTGRENIYLNAGLLGMRHSQVDEVFDDIVRFSGIEAFIDQPVETYSSGMYVRIGFAVAAHTNPDIFLADEVLAVGDAEFQRRCREKIGELREQGKTIVFVSHDLGIVNTLCERVVLLDKGRMIQRETAHKTITYYLRQIGMEQGLHSFQDDAIEAIHCDGRLALFYQREEVSSPTGFQAILFSLGQRHESVQAAWKVTHRGPSGCRAEGHMLGLPIYLYWEFRIEAGRLTWAVAMHCERDTPFDAINISMNLRTVYDRWVYGDLTGTFPEITPSDTSWMVLVAPEAKARDAAALPRAGAALPPLVFHMTPHNPYFGFLWANTEYSLYSRVLCARAHFPEHDNIFTAGRHDLCEITMDFSVPESGVMEHICADHILDCGRLSARFEQGQIRIRADDVEITAHLHLYASILISQLWNDSQGLQWQGVRTIPDGIRITGESRRFPFRMEWLLTRRTDAFHFSICLDVLAPLELQEYQTSIVLPDRYRYWATEHEQGTFPDHAPGASHWTHCNRYYGVGACISACGAQPPGIRMTIDEACPPVRMTAINTAYQEHTRALQALRPLASGQRRFDVGRHPFFSAVIALDDTMRPPDATTGRHDDEGSRR